MKDTYMAKAGGVEKKWYVVDAAGQTVGRLAAEIAKVLPRILSRYREKVPSAKVIFLIFGVLVKILSQKRKIAGERK